MMHPAAAQADFAGTSGRVIPVIKETRQFFRGRHSHSTAHLIYAISGVVAVTTDVGTWVVPPNRAIWVPAGTEHATRSYGPVKFRALRIAAEAGANLPSACCIVDVSPLLRELILRLAAIPREQQSGRFASRVIQLLLDELSFRPEQPLSLPMPEDPRLRDLCAAIALDPGPVSLKRIAAKLGMSRSTFMRHFRNATGLSFGRWHQQARLLKSLSLLATGRSVLEIALDCGYQSPSAFTAMFKRALGKTPRDYFR
jgi:AraC-like DNA-binding protein